MPTKTNELTKAFVARDIAGNAYILEAWVTVYHDRNSTIPGITTLFTEDGQIVGWVRQGHYQIDDLELWSDDPDAP